MRLSQDRVLRALSRFDSATVEEVATGLGGTHLRTTWHHLQRLVAQGMATKSAERIAKYTVTETGRLSLTKAA